VFILFLQCYGILIVLVGLLWLIKILIFGPSGRHKNKKFNKRWGKHQILFSDNSISEVMCKDTANKLASLCGGKVVRAKFKISRFKS